MIRAKRTIVLTAFALATLATAPAAKAQSIVDSWNSVAIPPVPELHPVTVEAAQAALLILDVNAQACAARPTCVRSIPHIQHLLANARAHHMLVIYSTSSAAPAAPTPEPLARAPNDPLVTSSADKFVGTDLEKILTDRGIKTVIVTGTSAQGAVLYTASEAALRKKMAVIVPVDGFSSDAPFAELVTAWLLKNAPVSVSRYVTLTRSDLVTLR